MYGEPGKGRTRYVPGGQGYALSMDLTAEQLELMKRVQAFEQEHPFWLEASGN